MTEQEAKTKWCPFARAGHLIYDLQQKPALATINRRDGGADPKCMCLASDCMVWRTYDDGKQGYCALAQPIRGVPLP